MTALRCDACGAGLSMDESGNFAVCEYCGMKHTNDRINVKIQEIKGIVEITKGEEEKKRLLKNAETFIELGKISSAEDVYTQLTNDYPNDWIGWGGKAFIQMLHFPDSFSSNDISEFIKNKPTASVSELLWNEGSNFYARNYYKFIEPFINTYMLFEDYSNTAKKISADNFQQYIEAKWNQHNTLHDTFISNLENDLANGNICFDKISCFFADCAYIPEKLRPIMSLLKENADKVNLALENSKNRYENFDSLGEVLDFKFDFDGSKEFEKIAFLSMSEAVLSGRFRQGDYGSVSKGVTLAFNKKYTTDQLIEELIKPTKNEQKILWINAGLCENCGSTIAENHFCKKCNHLNENRRTAVSQKILSLCQRFPDQVNLLEELDSNFARRVPGIHSSSSSPRKIVYMSGLRPLTSCTAKIEKIEIHSTCVFIWYYCYSQGIRNGHYIDIHIDNNNDIQKLIEFLESRSVKNVCQICGGSFKGVFTKVCSDCGAKKNF